MPFSNDGVNDMFWPPAPWNATAASDGCLASWGVRPRPDWPVTQWGGKGLEGASNIVFSNGLLDPWDVGGVLETSPAEVARGVVAVLIPSGAHHLDLFFSHPDDPQDVTDARAVERDHIASWIASASHSTSRITPDTSGITSDAHTRARHPARQHSDPPQDQEWLKEPVLERRAAVA